MVWVFVCRVTFVLIRPVSSVEKVCSTFRLRESEHPAVESALLMLLGYPDGSSDELCRTVLIPLDVGLPNWRHRDPVRVAGSAGVGFSVVRHWFRGMAWLRELLLLLWNQENAGSSGG